METAMFEAGDCDTPGALADAAAQGALLGARGNSGVIMSQILRGFADGMDSQPALSPMQLAQAMVSASDRAYQAVIKPVEGTILTVIKDAAGAALMSALDDKASVRAVLDAALAQARETLARTPSMLDKLRRAGVVDAGGQGLVFFFEGMLKALLGQTPAAAPMPAALARTAQPQSAADLAFRYCTEVSFNAPPGALDAVRAALSEDSDSLVVVGAGEMVKVHVHTNRPDTVLAQALEHGELIEVKVDNMAMQHNEIIVAEAQDTRGAGHGQEPPRGRTAVAAVVSGAGLQRIFRDMGASIIISGGQSMNPSTEDILNALRDAPEPEIIILPNNGNIIMAAERAAELDGRPVRVAPTRNIPQGLAALMDFDPEAPAADLEPLMRDAMQSVMAAEITQAVRDSSAADFDIRENDFIAVVDGDIRSCAPALSDLLSAVCRIFDEQELELVTFYTGEPLPDHEAEALIDNIKKEFPSFEYQIHRGGQPLYHFLISAE
jgi:DAK2 domain fusion protein YloV